jgi:DNA polymerase-1
MLYGGGLAKASATIAKFEGLPTSDPETTRPHYENFKGTMPGVIAAGRRATNLAEQRGYVRLWTGRRRHLRSDYYRAFNSVLQGGGAELVKRSQIRLQEIESPDCKMVLQVHDEIVFKITKGYREKVEAQIIKAMTDWSSFDVKFKVEGKIWNQ